MKLRDSLPDHLDRLEDGWAILVSEPVSGVAQIDKLTDWVRSADVRSVTRWNSSEMDDGIMLTIARDHHWLVGLTREDFIGLAGHTENLTNFLLTSDERWHREVAQRALGRGDAQSAEIRQR